MNAAAAKSFEQTMKVVEQADKLAEQAYQIAMKHGAVSEWAKYDMWMARHHKHKRMAERYYGYAAGIR